MSLKKTLQGRDLTKCLFGLHQPEGEGLGPGQLPQHLGNFVMAAAHNGLVVDGLDAVAHTHGLDAVDDAPFFYPLEGSRDSADQ